MTCGDVKRHARDETEKILKRDKALIVRLDGGPMNIWVVDDDADVLRDDWYTTWPNHIAAEWEPGHYVIQAEMERDARVAAWEPFEPGRLDGV